MELFRDVVPEPPVRTEGLRPAIVCRPRGPGSDHSSSASPAPSSATTTVPVPAAPADSTEHHLSLPLRLAHLVLQHLHDAEAAWESSRSASTAPWLFAGPNPARPIQSQYIYPKLRRALAGDVSASVLAPLTGTSIDNATRWANFVKRNWTDYIAGGKGA